MDTAEFDQRLDAIREAPTGPTVGAYFDFDGTVIAGYSAGAFYRRRLLDHGVGVPELIKTLARGLRGIESADDFEKFLELTLASWSGRTVAEVDELSRRIFVDDIAGQLHREIWDLVQAHRAKGHRIVLASSATRFQVEQMAEELRVDAVLCTELEVVEDRLTGSVCGPSMWGKGKALAVAKDIAEHGIDALESFAYSNGEEDVPFLRAVGHPVAVSPTPALRLIAEELGWPVLTCTPRPGIIPSVGDIARTAGFYGGMVGAIGTGIGIGLLNRSRRQAVDVSVGVGGDVSLGLAGVDLAVQGLEHLTAARPCVFIFNHQSNLDIPIMMQLLRGGFTGVAKLEAAAMPLWGQFFRFANVAFVDRADSSKARAALAPAVARLREDGISLALAPEGTRTPTPRLAAFKKGAFHIAMDAEVPMVPIVIRNAGEVMSRGARTIHPGTVEVCVLPPVSTQNWSPDTLDDHVHQVRSMFEQTLAAWPRERQT